MASTRQFPASEPEPGSRIAYCNRTRRHARCAGAPVFRSRRRRRVSSRLRCLGVPVRPLSGACFEVHLTVIKQGVSHRPRCRAQQGAGADAGRAARTAAANFDSSKNQPARRPIARARPGLRPAHSMRPANCLSNVCRAGSVTVRGDSRRVVRCVHIGRGARAIHAGACAAWTARRCMRPVPDQRYTFATFRVRRFVRREGRCMSGKSLVRDRGRAAGCVTRCTDKSGGSSKRNALRRIREIRCETNAQHAFAIRRTTPLKGS